MAKSVHYYDSTQTGAPVLNGQPASLIAVLDALLCDGFNSQTVTSIVVSGGVATVTKTGHGFKVDEVVLHSGATSLAALNGESRVTYADTNTYHFATTAANGTESGTVTAKIAPVGWTKIFSGTNKAIYQRPDVDATAMVLRIDDSNAQYARVRGYESATGVDSATNPFPTLVQAADASFICPKSSSADSTARGWRLFADGKRLLFFPRWSASYPTKADQFFFGDVVSYKTADAYHCLISAVAAASVTTPGTYNTTLVYNANTYASTYFARAVSQVGSAAAGAFDGVLSGNIAGSAQNTVIGGAGPVYPNGADNALLLRGRAEFADGSCLRGYLPGIYLPWQVKPLADGDIVKNIAVGGLSGRSLVAISVNGGYSTNAYEGRVFIDSTGPWQ